MPRGKITNLRHDLGVIVDERGNRFHFTVDHIEGFCEQKFETMKEFGPKGLVVGSDVYFLQSHEGKVRRVMPLTEFMTDDLSPRSQ